jgi:pimeloyl-ACP methyl ester carboxylesterase
LPTVVLSGERDKTCPRWHSERLGAEIPPATNVWLPDIGHMVVYEAPDAIVQEIMGFFDRTLSTDVPEQLL